MKTIVLTEVPALVSQSPSKKSRTLNKKNSFSCYLAKKLRKTFRWGLCSLIFFNLIQSLRLLSLVYLIISRYEFQWLLEYFGCFAAKSKEVVPFGLKITTRESQAKTLDIVTRSFLSLSSDLLTYPRCLIAQGGRIWQLLQFHQRRRGNAQYRSSFG